MNSLSPRQVRLAELLAAHATDDDRCPRQALRDAFAREFPGTGHRPHTIHLGRRLKGKTGSPGRTSTDRLNDDLVRFERAGIITRVDDDWVRLVDWTSLLAVMRRQEAV